MQRRTAQRCDKGLDSHSIWNIISVTHRRRLRSRYGPNPPQPRQTRTLRKQGTLHPHPDAVTAESFQNSDFFDPQDLVQVKYEMLRRVEAEQASVSQAAQEFGLSRPSFYQAQTALQQGGLAGLIRQKPGPRRAHKLTAPVLDFLEATRAAQPTLRYAELAQQALKRFGVRIHPRTIERVVSRRQKKLR